jgi:hypothetical protein
MIEHLLVALDDPDDPEILFPVIRRIARPKTSRVSLLQSAPFLETVIEMPSEFSPRLHADDEAAVRYVSALVARLASEGLTVDGFTEIGQSGTSIAAEAERIGASFVLLALRQPSRIKTLLSTTSIPVLAVPPGKRVPPAQILVPIDDEASLEAIPYAATMARTFESEIAFVVATTTPLLLAKARERARREDASAEVAVFTDDVVATLLTLAATMIVMRSEPEDAVVRLVRETKVPVLLFHRPIRVPEQVYPAPLHIPMALWFRKISRSPLEGIGGS